MKIDLNSPSASLLPVDRGVKQVSTSSTAATQGATEDRTTLHSGSQTIQSLTAQALNSPEVRQDKVDTLRQSVNSGSYPLDATKIASAIVESSGQ
jgi:flagellar biosynthesis anti-sigma factor FlgM